MSAELTRRQLFAGAAATGAAATVLDGSLLGGVAAAAPAPAGSRAFPGATVTPDDPRYSDLVRNWNARFTGSPDYIQLVGSAAQVEAAVARAVGAGRRLVVRSGGHCLEGFVGDPTARVLIDLGQLNDIYFDRERNAFAIEPGASLRQVFRELYTGWGVTIPGGVCPSVAAGGHICGGGFGLLARRAGPTSDHLYAVEVVVVDESGTPSTVVATREPHDPHRGLWWAHTGGGGGNFGVVTKYWMRSPNATGEPGRLLPRPEREMRLVRFDWPWSGLTEDNFVRLVRNYLEWFTQHSAPGSPYSRLNADLFLLHVSSGNPYLIVTLDPTEPGSDSLFADFRAAVTESVTAPGTVHDTLIPWLQSTNLVGYPDTGDAVLRRSKNRTAYVRSSYSDAQIRTIYRGVTRPGYSAPTAMVWFAGYGCQANAVAPDATALPQRDSVLKVYFNTSWLNPADDNLHLSWARELYRDVHAASGGVPELDGQTDGVFVNFPDVDLSDPAWNTSGIPWHRLYYKGNYPRLQQVKAAYDPRNVFNHAQSVQLPG
jgi:aclacinomycin oxidase